MSEELGLKGDFPGREKHGCFSRSLHGWIHGGPENPLSNPAPEDKEVVLLNHPDWES
jgi:hypothetical protein